jgi:hypothetical protein
MVFVAGGTAAGASANPRQGGAGTRGLSGANATSQYFAGYQVSSTGAPISTTEQFRLPPLNCTTTAPSLSSPDIQISLPAGLLIGTFLSTSTSLQSDSDWAWAGVFENCKPGYGYSSYTIYLCLPFNPQFVQTGHCKSGFAPQAGDLIKVTVSVSPTASKAVVKDKTQAVSKSIFGPGMSILRSVGLGVAPWIGPTPVSNFGTLTFSDTVDGLTPKAAGATAINMETTTGILQVSTGALNTAGNGWTEVWNHS